MCTFVVHMFGEKIWPPAPTGQPGAPPGGTRITRRPSGPRPCVWARASGARTYARTHARTHARTNGQNH